MLKTHLKQIAYKFSQGDAQEGSYYPFLKDLLNEFCNSIGKKNIHITILPKKTEAGYPDFRLRDGKQHFVGFIEAIGPAFDNLDRIGDTEQLKEYRDTYPMKNLYGKVENIQAGSGAAFSLFPPENATGNWVKVVQRIPVKIVLERERNPNLPLRVGMSVITTVLAKN